MKAFIRQLECFASSTKTAVSATDIELDQQESGKSMKDQLAVAAERSRRRYLLQAFLQFLFLLIIAFAYAHQTWKFGSYADD